MKLLSRLAPHARLSQNPLFNLEVRRIRWGVGQQALLRHSLWRLAVISAVVLPIWLLSAMPNPLRSGVNDFVLLLLGASLLAGLALDYASMSAALGSINGAMATGRWDLLRLTALTIPQIITARHGAAQVRAWRWMILLVALRFAVGLILGINLALMISQSGWLGITTTQAFTTLIASLVLALLFLAFTVEPFLRMRAVTALGVAISARVRQSTSTVLAAGGVIALMWLGQGFVAAAVALLFSGVLVPLGFLEEAAYGVALCAPVLLVALFWLTVYGFYSVVQTWSLRRAENWIARIE